MSVLSIFLVLHPVRYAGTLVVTVCMLLVMMRKWILLDYNRILTYGKEWEGEGEIARNTEGWRKIVKKERRKTVVQASVMLYS